MVSILQRGIPLINIHFRPHRSSSSCHQPDAVLTHQSNFHETLLSFLLTFNICLNVCKMSLHLNFSLFCFCNSQNGSTVGFSPSVDHTRLFNLEGMEVKNSWNLSSANSLLRRAHLVDVECFLSTWLHIKYVYTAKNACMLIQQRIFQGFSHSVLILTWTTASLTFCSREWFRIMYQPMFKIFVCNKDTFNLCPHLVISSAPKTVVRNVQTKETTEKTI